MLKLNESSGREDIKSKLNLSWNFKLGFLTCGQQVVGCHERTVPSGTAVKQEYPQASPAQTEGALFLVKLPSGKHAGLRG